MGSKLKVNGAAAGEFVLSVWWKPTAFSRPWSPFGFTQQYRLLLLKAYNAYTLFPGAFSCNWAHLV